MRASDIYRSQDSPFRGADAYVVGLGPSMKAFRLSWLEGRFCVLLNDAQKHYLSLGPVAVANHRHFLSPLSEKIKYPIVKCRLKSDPNPHQDDNHVPWNHPNYYCFSYRMGAIGETPDHQDPAALWRDDDHLWGGGTIASFAIQILLRAGVKSIVLVGCDCIPLRGIHYSHAEVQDDRARWSKARKVRKGKFPVKHDYAMYTRSLQIMQREAWSRFKVPVMTLTPFVGLSDPAEQLRAFVEWSNNGSEQIDVARSETPLERRKRIRHELAHRDRERANAASAVRGTQGLDYP